MSRWGINENIFPFVFIIGFLLVITSQRENKNFILACVFFSLCLYAYGAAYIVIPIFLSCTIIILLYWKRANIKNLVTAQAAETKEGR
jgi:glycerol-3-phosphate acyltransferase PlsY